MDETMQRSVGKLYLLGFCSLFLIVSVDVLLNFDAHGTTWDEFFHYSYGEQKIQYYRDLLSGKDTDHHFADKGSNNYPGFFDISMAAFRETTGMNPSEAGHLCAAISGILGIVGAWATGTYLGGPRAGFFAALFLTFMPRFYGHLWFNVKDVPFAAAYIWAVFFVIVAIKNLPRFSLRTFIPAGLAVGVALGIRPAALLLIFYMGIAFAIDLLRLMFSDARRNQFFAATLRYLGFGIGFYLLAILAMIPWWPYAHQNPLWIPIEVVLNLHSFPFSSPNLFFGEYLAPQDIPWYYLPTWLAITTPIPILLLWILAAANLVAIPRKMRGIAQGTLSNDSIQKTVLGLAFGFPIVYSIALSPDLYDGLRQMLFILPAGAVVAALTLEKVLEYIAAPKIRVAFGLFVAAATVLLVLPSYIRLFPYQYVYFNEAIGGLQGAFRKFDSDYYGLSYREAAETLNEIHPELLEGRKAKVAVAGPSWFVAGFLGEQFELTENAEEADYYLSYLRWESQARFPGHIVGFVERDGVPLNLIIARNPPNSKNDG